MSLGTSSVDGQSRANPSKPAPTVGRTSAAKLASLDWPPPPSPATTMRPHSGVLDLGRAIERGLGATSPAFEQEDCRNRVSRATELHNRQELWEVRAEIEKEKLRHVAPFPFFGRAMRFQDEFAALQITDDGRFSYSFVGLNYEVVDLEGGEQPSLEDPKVSRVLTYEGVLISPVEQVPLEEAEPEAEGSAKIEGLAMAKHEIEDVGGRARLVSISRSSSRFAIVVSPYFQPNMAVVYSLHLARSPRRPRRTQLPYVGRGMKRDLRAATMRSGDVWRLTQERRRTPKPKFSKSGSTSLLPAAAPSRRMKDGEDRNASKLTGVASMPQLPALVETKDKKAEKTSVADWREMWKQRALQELLGS